MLWKLEKLNVVTCSCVELNFSLSFLIIYTTSVTICTTWLIILEHLILPFRIYRHISHDSYLEQWSFLKQNQLVGLFNPSMYGATAPSGPWPPSKDASIRPYFQLLSSILVSLVSVVSPSGQHAKNQILVLMAGSSFICWFHPRHLWGFLNICPFMGWACNPTPNPQPGGPGCPFLSGPSPLACPAWETLPVATLLLA
jgi:hypothetical protein